MVVAFGVERAFHPTKTGIPNFSFKRSANIALDEAKLECVQKRGELLKGRQSLTYSLVNGYEFGHDNCNDILDRKESFLCLPISIL